MKTPNNNNFNKKYRNITFKSDVTPDHLLHTIFNYCVSYGENILLHHKILERLSQIAVQIEPINNRKALRITGEFYTVSMGFVEYNSDFIWVDIISYSVGVAVRDPNKEPLIFLLESDV